MPRNHLFGSGDLREWLDGLKAQLKAEVEATDADYVLNVSESDLVAHLVSKFTRDTPQLREDEIYVVSSKEVQVDVTGDHRRYFSTPGPHHLKGTQIVVGVPFDGNPALFSYKPSTFTYNPPSATVAGGELRITVQGIDLSSEQVKSRYQETVADVRQWLGWTEEQVKQFNTQLEPFARGLVTTRREKVLSDRSLVEGLGIPVRRRPSEATTYVTPGVRRKPGIIVPKPETTREPFTPEPVMDETMFEDILGIIRGMALVMERSPRAFAEMEEEDLRQHFLVQLNGQFEGAATGETFNYEGKTDILIRIDDRNVFIGECKVWGGPKTITETIDQILGYLSWRDTKAAIVLFVRNKNFSAVVDQIVRLVEVHPNFKRTLGQTGESEFRFVLGQRDDPNREIKLVALLFSVPSPNEKRDE